MASKKHGRSMKPAMLLILMMGIVSLFFDMTHEGASSTYGAFTSPDTLSHWHKKHDRSSNIY